MTQPPAAVAAMRMIITGRVVDEVCRPLAGTTLDIHQTDANGEYGPGHNTPQQQCCYYMGLVRTSADGSYRFVTVRPGYYKDAPWPPPPSHIHISVGHPAARALEIELEFDDDPLVTDQSYVPPDDAVIIHVDRRTDASGSFEGGVFDIVLKRK